MRELESRVRAKVSIYTYSLFIGIASYLFLTTVPFLPAPPVLPLLVALGLGALSIQKKSFSIASLYLLVYFSTLWQMIGFGFFQLFNAGVGMALVITLALPLLSFVSKRVELSSMALAVLAVALMLTPAYFVSVPLIAVAATVSGFASLEALATTFILFLAPFLLLENALYFTATSSATSPIIFAQLSLLSQNLRPPLPGLNIFLTGLPSNYLSGAAQGISKFLIQSSNFMIIPLVLLGVTLVAASGIGGVTHTALERVGKMHENEKVRRIVAPLAVSVVTPSVFILLISVLSQPGSGGFQTSLTNDPSHLQAAFMIGASVILGGTFVGRESLIEWLEKVQVGRDRVTGQVQECRLRMNEVSGEIAGLVRKVPSMNLSTEEKGLSEYASYLDDVERQVKSAGNESLAQWSVHIETLILRPLREAPDRLKAGLLNEINTLITVTQVVNNHLEEAGVSILYPAMEVQRWSSLEEMIAIHDRTTLTIRDVTANLSELYRSTYDSMSKLMGLQEVNLPVSPTALLDSNEYVTAMRLVSEEYWLNFHLRWAEELEGKKAALLEKLTMIDEFLDEDEGKSLRGTVMTIAKAKPADSTCLLKKMQEIIPFFEKVLSRLGHASEQVEKMISLEPGASKILIFQTVIQIEEVIALERKLVSVGVTFDEVTTFVTEAIPALAGQSTAWKNDEENLMIMAQYPLAKKIIERMLTGQRTLKTAKLPYQRRSANIYARLYASANPTVRFDDEDEELVAVAKHA